MTVRDATVNQKETVVGWVSDPFLIQGPAVISFSGGRTSAYMLWRILQAHGGTLPDDVRVVFANTGKEMPETLDFVEECSKQWNVKVHWVEYGRGEIDYKTASRKGEPYELLISSRGYLPNPVTRFCSIELKIRPIAQLAYSWWPEYTKSELERFAIIGIRADEPRRVAKIGLARAPLAMAGITAQDVGNFWMQQPFDLRLPNMNGKTMHGNCDLCFLKGQDQVLSLIRENPKRAIWWMEQEARIKSSGKFTGDGYRFRIDRPSYAEMHRMATEHGELFAYDDEPLQDCFCVD